MSVRQQADQVNVRQQVDQVSARQQVDRENALEQVDRENGQEQTRETDPELVIETSIQVIAMLPGPATGTSTSTTVATLMSAVTIESIVPRRFRAIPMAAIAILPTALAIGTELVTATTTTATIDGMTIGSGVRFHAPFSLEQQSSANRSITIPSTTVKPSTTTRTAFTTFDKAANTS